MRRRPAAQGGVLRRPSAQGGILRRPAARLRQLPLAAAEGEAEEEEEASEGFHEEAKKEYQAGKVVLGHHLQPGVLCRGDWIVADEAIYFQKKVALAGRVVKEEIEGGEREVTLELTGTQSEELLKFGTSAKPSYLRIHLCRAGCNQLRENPDLAHVRKLKKISSEEGRTWEINLIENAETGLLQQEEAEWRRREEGKKEKAEKRSSSSSTSHKKKKRRKKKKEKKEKKKRGEEESPVRSRVGGRTVAKKTLEALYKGTGLDPSVKRRRKLNRKVRKALKKCKESASSSSPSSSGTSSEMEGDDLLEDRSKIHRISTLGPGLLAAQSINGMKQYLTQVTGTGWESESQSLPPLLCLYHRTYLASKLSGGVAREMATLAWVGDLLLQARPAEALDGVLQRMKSIEMTANGTAWSTSQKLELVPATEVAIGSRQEFQIAKREARLDMETKGGGGQSSDKGKTKGKEKGVKGKDRGKGKSKEGEKKSS